ncbi:hypothetical protein ACFLYH_00920 [Candidatus Dependentiae bacterium]
MKKFICSILSIFLFTSYKLSALGEIMDVTKGIKPGFVEKIGLFLAGAFIIKIIKIVALIALIIIAIIVAIKIYKKFFKKN